MKRFGERKTLVGERRKKATNQDKTKNRPIKFNLPRSDRSHATNEMRKRYFWKNHQLCRHHHQVLSTFYPHARFCKERYQRELSPRKRTHEIEQRVCVDTTSVAFTLARSSLRCFARRSGEHKKKDLELGDVERRRLER